MKFWAFAWLALVASPALADLPVIRSGSDVPATRFTLDAKPSLAFSDADFLKTVVPQLRAEAERLLATYRIEDPAIAQRLHSGLAAIALLQGRPRDADRLIGEQRKAETKPQLQTIGMLLADLAAAKMAATAGRGCAAAADRLTMRLAGADPAIVRDETIIRYSDVQTASVAYYAGAGAFMLDDEAQTRGSIGVIDGMYMATWRVIAEQIPSCRPELSIAFKTWLDAPANQPVNIWPAREPDPTMLAGAKPVVVAVWESGFDPSLFPGQRAIDPAEPLDGKDNDGNGIVDDSHGPTFDYNLRPTAHELPPLSPFLAARWGLQLAIEKGQTDLNYADDTADARFFASRARDASVAEQIEDMAGSDEFIARTHATWIASIIADNAPYVRLYDLVAYPFGANPKPMPVVESDVDRWIALMPGLAARLRGAHVRLVNMSWSSTIEALRDRLLQSGAETDAERATARATVMHNRLRTAITGMIRLCPDILFIAAAGNSNKPEEIQAAIPQILDAANLLIVGGTGANGHATAFTTYGKHVRLYARAEGVTVRAPGGMVMKSSGTSFAAPLTARAAAAMLAVNPQLSPAQLIEGLLATGTDAGGLTLLHPGQAVTWAAGQRK